MIQIVKVQSSADLKEFIRFPFKLYKGNPHWVPELDKSERDNLKNNPALEFCKTQYWLAKKDGNTVGRIAGIINQQEVETAGKVIARFGWLDFIEDEEVSMQLLTTAEEWAKNHGAVAIHGPLGFTDLDKQGMLTEGFDRLSTIATLYNYPYYPEHLEKLGYSKSAEWFEFEIDVPDSLPDRVVEFAKKIGERYQLRELPAKKSNDYKPYIPQIFDILNEAYADLYGYVLLDDQQIKFYADQYFGFINPDFITVIVDDDDQVVAFGVTMPSFSRAFQKSNGKLFPFGFIHLLKAMKKNDRADFYLIGIRKEYQRKGVTALMFTKIYNGFKKFGIRKVETNPELENNLHIQNIWKDYDPRNHKKRRCYIKDLS